MKMMMMQSTAAVAAVAASGCERERSRTAPVVTPAIVMPTTTTPIVIPPASSTTPVVTPAIVMPTAKLDDATVHRTKLHEDGCVADSLLSKFVCDDGLSAARSAVSSGRIDPERCDCIIWFSDLAGFSKHASTLSPSESGTLVRELMEVQASAIQSASGQIDKFMGDGLMAFWRVPDDSRKRVAATCATQTAIDAVEKLTSIFRTRALPLDVRIGLHLGPVMLGDFGGGPRIAFTCIGEAVNTASRYEQAVRRIDHKPLGRVRMSPALWAHLSDRAIIASFDGVEGAFEDKHMLRYSVYSMRA